MPSRKTARHDIPNSYYHVYVRGINKERLFLDSSDKEYFLYLLARYLSKERSISKARVAYPNYHNQVELLSFCLMDNHFHLLIYQVEQQALARFMKSLMTCYSAYFNRKNNRTGPVYGGRYRASLITSDVYLFHISRYIHLNPRSWKYFPFSSLKFIRKGNEPEWLQTDKVLALHKNRQAYIEFVADYEDYKKSLDEIKHDLANL